jgi:hypothetical protein
MANQEEIAVRLSANAKQLVDEMSKAARGVDGFAVKHRAAFKAVDESERASAEVSTRMGRRRIAQQNALARANDKASRDAIRDAQRIMREKERTERQMTRTAEREARARERIAHREAVEIAKAQRTAAAAQARTLKEQQRRGAVIGGGVGGAMSGAGGSMLGAAAGLGLGFGFTSVIKDVRDFDALLTDVAITGGKQGEWITKVGTQIEQISNRTGRSKADIAGYLKTIAVQTGDVDSATKSLDAMAKAAVATGAAFEDIGTVQVTMASIGVTADQMGQAMNVFADQAKVGSVEFKTLATRLPDVVSSMSTVFGAKAQGMKGATAAGALYQIAGRGMIGREGHAAETIRDFMREFGQTMAKDKDRGKFLRGLGLKEKDLGKMTKEGFQLNDVESVMGTLATAFAAKPGALAKSGTKWFGATGMEFASRLRSVGQAGWGGQVGQYASAGSLFAAGKKDVIGADYAQRMASQSARFDVALRRMINTLQKEAIPIFEKLVAQIPVVMRAFNGIIDNFKLIIALWATGKLRAFLASLAGAAAGGGAVRGGVVAGAAGAAGAGGMVIGGGAIVRILGAVQLVGAAYVIGKEVGAYLFASKGKGGADIMGWEADKEEKARERSIGISQEQQREGGVAGVKARGVLESTASFQDLQTDVRETRKRAKSASIQDMPLEIDRLKRLRKKVGGSLETVGGGAPGSLGAIAGLMSPAQRGHIMPEIGQLDRSIARLEAALVNNALSKAFEAAAKAITESIKKGVPLRLPDLGGPGSRTDANSKEGKK